MCVLGGFLLAVFLGVGVFVVLVDRAANKVRKGSKYEVNVTYRVEGSASSVGITYTVGVDHTATDTAASLPWTTDVATGGTVSLITAPLATASCRGDAGLLPAR
jgi:hypothetical protein